MIAKDTTTSASIQTIEQDTRSISTTNANTLNLLRAILGRPLEASKATAQLEPVSAARKASRDVPASLKKKPVRSAKNKNHDFEIFESPDIASGPVSAAEQRRVATETFNVVLKNLSRAAKEHKLGRPGTIKETPTGRKDVLPPQHCSPNRPPLVPTNRAMAKNASPSKAVTSPIGQTADCALLCLGKLFEIDLPRKGEHPQNVTEDRLVQGSLVLLDKLVTLQLRKESVNLAYILKSRLEAEKCSEPPDKGPKPRVAIAIAASDYYHLLSLDINASSKATCESACTLQSQVLRLALMETGFSITEDLRQCLHPTEPRGPAGLILARFRMQYISTTEASTQFRTLSQAIISLCSSVESHAATTSALTNLLRLRVQALQIRCHALSIQPSNGTWAGDLWAHVGRYLRKFHSHELVSHQNTFDLSVDIVEDFQTTLKNCGSSTQIPFAVCDLLAEAAVKDGKAYESIQYLRPWIEQPAGRSDASIMLLKCRIATAQLAASQENCPEALKWAKSTLEVLRTFPPPLFPDILQDLVYLARLRKAALKLAVQEEQIEGSKLSCKQEETTICAIEIVYALQNLLANAGSGLGTSQTARKAALKSDDHLKSLEVFERKTSEAVVTIAKLPLAASPAVWSQTDMALQSCLVRRSLTTNEPDDSILKAVSGTYWHWYERKRGSVHIMAESQYLLAQSIAALANCSVDTKHESHLPLKQLHLAAEHKRHHQNHHAYAALRNAADVMVEAGIVDEMLEASLSMPTEKLCSSGNIHVQTFGKCLANIAECVSENSTNQTETSFYDVASLGPSHRALVLTRQLLSYLSHCDPAPKLEINLADVVKEILQMFEESQLQICRLQFACDLLVATDRKHQDLPLVFLTDRLDVLAKATAEGHGSGLAAYAVPFKAISTVLWTLRTGLYDAQVLRVSLTDLEKYLSDTAKDPPSDQYLPHANVLGQRLGAFADYMTMLGRFRLARQALNIQRDILVLHPTKQDDYLAECLLKLAELQGDAGETLLMKQTLDSARNLLAKLAESQPLWLRYHAACAEHALLGDRSEQCRMELQSAWEYVERCSPAGPDVGTRARCETEKLLGRVNLIFSQLAFKNHDSAGSILHARRSTKLLASVWALIERSVKSSQTPPLVSGPGADVKSLCIGVSELTLEGTSPPSQLQSGSAPFWPLARLHVQALLENARLCSHAGQYQDAKFFAEQAKQIANKTGALALLLESNIALSIILQRGTNETADISTAVEGFCPSDMDILEPTLSHASISVDAVRLSLLLTDPIAIETSIKKAKLLLDAIAKQSLELKVRLPSESNKAILKTSRAVGRAPKKPTSSMAKSYKQNDESQSEVAEDRGMVMRLRRELQLLEHEHAFRQNKLTCAKGLLRNDTQDSVLLWGMVQLGAVVQSISDDSVHCALDETPLCIPSIDRVSSEADEAASGVKTTTAKQSDLRVKAVKLKRPATKEVKSECGSSKSLRELHTLLSRATEADLLELPSYCLHQRERIMNKAAMLEHALNATTTHGPASPDLTSKSLTRRRERAIMSAESACLSAAQVHARPESPHAASQVAVASAEINQLPSSWVVVHISLDDSASEMRISRQKADSIPFTLRLPLTRSSADELDDIELSFPEAKAELDSIIRRANITAHGAPRNGDSTAKRAWWAEREELDSRLEALLRNIENLWLGGFRSIFGHQKIDNTLMTNFTESMTKSLKSHLPSRQRSGIDPKKYVVLSDQVLELFVLLGHPDEAELDDAITDLLYFVIDILRLNGEINAYDEIDFDVLVLEVFDALRAYHGSQNLSRDNEQTHIILILDKELQCFPWESLPFLSSRSISRIPSIDELAALTEKLVKSDSHPSSLKVSRKSGSIMLNPSGDLVATRERFEPTFDSQLQNFDRITGTVPTEQDFLSCLTDHDLFLYFGHGSGAQYVRARSIKKLDKCAVTFLMGCSSSKMTECGQYEPHGMPWNYMLAGSPAVVGTLWDVTDKDIDRFAMRTFVNWGLLDGTAEAELGKSGRKGKGKKMEKQQDHPRRARMTLSEAVMDARDVCVLRYLNGAAPVIYGVPVHLV